MKRAARPNRFAPPPIAADAALADWIEDQLARSDRARPLIEPVALFLAPTIALPPGFLEQPYLVPALPHSVSGQCSWNGGFSPCTRVQSLTKRTQWPVGLQMPD
jgi:hypothetical protein